MCASLMNDDASSRQLEPGRTFHDKPAVVKIPGKLNVSLVHECDDDNDDNNEGDVLDS